MTEPAPPPRRRAPPRKKGDAEKGLDYDLGKLPEEYRKGGIAAVARILARSMDAGGMTARDEAGHAAQIRQALVQLREWAPSAEAGDATGEAQAASESARALYAVPAPGPM